MNDNKATPLAGDARFKAKSRSYHLAKAEDGTWDDWIGDKAKSPLRKKFDKTFLTITVLLVGVGLIGGAFAVSYVFLQKLLPMISK